MHGLFYDLALAPLEALTLRHLRHELLSRAKGKTLEIGIGTGLNVPHYPIDVELVAIEPEDSMRARAPRKIQRTRGPQHIHVLTGDAQALAFSSEEFDTVVGTLVFCTIPDPDRAIDEVYRVLKPGGRFLLLEHVRRDTAIASWMQDRLTPIWKRLAHGCHLNRDPSGKLKSVGFKVESTRSIWRGFGQLWVLVKPPATRSTDQRP